MKNFQNTNINMTYSFPMESKGVTPHNLTNAKNAASFCESVSVSITGPSDFWI